MLVKEADKLTLKQKLFLTALYYTEGLLNGAYDRQMSNTQMIQYQGLLLDPPHISFHKISALNPLITNL